MMVIGKESIGKPSLLDDNVEDLSTKTNVSKPSNCKKQIKTKEVLESTNTLTFNNQIEKNATKFQDHVESFYNTCHQKCKYRDEDPFQIENCNSIL